MFMPVGIVLQGIYSKNFGLPLSAIAAVFLISRIFDAVSDPLVGYLSDRARARGISRKWWIVTGGLGLIVASFLLYTPAINPTFEYFLASSLAFYLAWTIFDVNHYAWGTELTREPAYRLHLFSVRGAMVYVGALSFYALPLIPLFGTTEYTPTTLKAGAILATVIMVPALVGAWALVPDGHPIERRSRESVYQAIMSILKNRPFLLYMSVFVLTGVSGGMWLALTFIVFNAYFGIGDNIAIMYTLGSVLGLISLPAWLKLANAIGKKHSWLVAQGMNVVFFFIPFFVKPGESAFAFLLVSTVGIFVSEGLRQGVLPSLLADIVDYGTWKSGTDRAATYFASNTLMQKISIGVGAAIGLALINALGFDPKTVRVGDEDARFAMRAAFCITPTIIVFISVGLLTRMKITSRHSSIIRRRLNAREERLRRDGEDPLTVEV